MDLGDVSEELPIVGENQWNRIHGGTCRICLKPMGWLLSINDGYFEDLCYKEIYMECIGKPLKDFTNHLSLICQACEDNLLQAYKFRKMCLKAEDALNELENSHIQIKREILEDYQENLFAKVSQNVEEPTVILSSIFSEDDYHIQELFDTERGKEKSLQDPTIERIQNNQRKCLETEDKLTYLVVQNDLLLQIKEENKFPTISSNKTDTNLTSDVPENKQDTDESLPKKKAKINKENTGDNIKNGLRSSPSVKEKINPIVSSVSHQEMFVTHDQLTAQSKPKDTKGTNKIAKKHTENASESEDEFGKTHEKCLKCFKRFKTPAYLETHMKLHDENVKYVKCKICGKNIPSYTRQRHVYHHKNLQFGKKTFKKTITCPRCPRNFSSQSGLGYHTIY